MAKQELSLTAKLSVYQLIYVPTMGVNHERQGYPLLTLHASVAHNGSDAATGADYGQSSQ